MAAEQTSPAALYRAMADKIVQIEQLAQELKEMGQGLPVVEKNARCILSFTHALGFGITGPAQVLED
jgi:hypothetical protein